MRRVPDGFRMGCGTGVERVGDEAAATTIQTTPRKGSGRRIAPQKLFRQAVGEGVAIEGRVSGGAIWKLFQRAAAAKITKRHRTNMKKVQTMKSESGRL